MNRGAVVVLSGLKCPVMSFGLFISVLWTVHTLDCIYVNYCFDAYKVSPMIFYLYDCVITDSNYFLSILPCGVQLL